MAYRIAVLPCDGIGPEITQATMTVLKPALAHHNIEVTWPHLPVGWEAINAHQHPIPEFVIAELATCDSWILGPHDCAAYPAEFDDVLNPSGTLRKHFDLYGNIRPARTFAGVPHIGKPFDIIVARENTEGFYADRNMHKGIGEVMVTPDLALVTGVFSRSAATRIAHSACQLAQGRRKHLTIVHKANVLKHSFGLFREACYDVAAHYPDLKVTDVHVDAMAAMLIRDPARFDVLVTENMCGDILSDLTTEMMGSLGLGGSINASAERAMAQAVHGAAPDIAGQGVANPLGLMNSALLMLEWLASKHNDPALRQTAHEISQAIDTTLAQDTSTPDLGGTASTAAFAEAVQAALSAKVA